MSWGCDGEQGRILLFFPEAVSFLFIFFVLLKCCRKALEGLVSLPWHCVWGHNWKEEKEGWSLAPSSWSAALSYKPLFNSYEPKVLSWLLPVSLSNNLMEIIRSQLWPSSFNFQPEKHSGNTSCQGTCIGIGNFHAMGWCDGHLMVLPVWKMLPP